MFVAIDENGEFVDVLDADKGCLYFCPICNGEVIVRDGGVNVKHFAHRKTNCLDNWHYDMSAWHRKMQSYFPKECREVVVSNDVESHRADVLIDNTVIEFQHSPISSMEFEERTDFFINLKYRVAWVFDVRDLYENCQIYHPEEREDQMLFWKYPSKCFSWGAWPNDFDKRFVVWFDFDNSLNKIIWCSTDLYGAPDYSKFIPSGHYLTYEEIIQTDKLFYSRNDYYDLMLAELKSKCKVESKYIGTKGKIQSSYICPRTKVFGLSIFGERACTYCKYCGLIAEKVRGKKKEYIVSCCYPNQVREEMENHPGNECGGVNFVEI